MPAADQKPGYVVSHKFPDNIYSSDQQNSTRFPSGIKGTGYIHPDSDDDDLYNRWLEDGNDPGIPLSSEDKNTPEVAESSEAIEVHYAEKPSVPSSSGTIVPETTEQEAAAANAVAETSKEDETMVDTQQIQESTVPLQELVSAKVASSNGDLNQTGHAVASRKTILVEKGNEVTSAGGNAEEVKASASVSDDDSSLASLPDILDDMQTDSDDELSSGN